MAELNNDISAYFAPTKGTFWKWSDDQQEVLWTCGSTIAFRSELELLLRALAAEGLPPFENILMVVAACRKQSQVQNLRSADVLDFSKHPMGFSLVEGVSKIITSLESLASLPEELRTTVGGKQAILTLVSENGPRRTSPHFSRACVEWITQGQPIEATAKIKSTSDWSAELRGLHDGLLAVNETAIRLRMETGVALLPVAAPIPWELPPPPPEPVPLTVRELLRELEDDEEHGGLVRLTQRLIAIMSLPRLISTPDQLPLGGVSDITNRGSFDRLLLSELAHDTDVLMTRVALNEAMYIRREVPPEFPPRQCLILVDSGIRMWGVPRLYATAVALALAFVQDGKAVPRLYRSGVNEPVPIDFTTKDEFIRHLAGLELPVHPGKSLARLVEEARDQASDFVVVTGEDVLADFEFRRCLGELRLPSCYLVTVTRTGHIRLLQRTARGERVLKQAKLDVDQILAGPPKQIPKLLDKSIDPRLPAICRVRPFPLLLSPQVKEENCGGFTMMPHSGITAACLLGVTGDHRLMCWNDSTLGAVQFSDRMPPGKLVWHSTEVTSLGSIQVLIAQIERPRLSLVTATPEKDDVKTLDVPLNPPLKAVYVHANVIYAVFKSQTVLFSLQTGERLFVMQHTARTAWMFGRFYFIDVDGANNGWYALVSDGHEARYEQIVKWKDLNAGIKTIFDCQHLGAPVVVTTHNTVIVTGSKERLQFTVKPGSPSAPPNVISTLGPLDGGTALLTLTAVTHDGNRFVLSPPPKPMTAVQTLELSTNSSYGPHWVVDLEQLTACKTIGTPRRLLSEHAFSLPRQSNLRNKFVRIGLNNGQLCLVTNKNKSLVLGISGDRFLLRSPEVVDTHMVPEATFQFFAAPSDVGYELKIAEWADGSRAILDSRGLLHLQSSDPSIPEMTFVLNVEDVAGWCDRNFVWGDKYVTQPDLNRTNPETVLREWLTPFCRRLR